MLALPNELLLRLLEASNEPLIVARVDQPDWPIVLANAAFESLAGEKRLRKQSLADVAERLVGKEQVAELGDVVRSGMKSALPGEVGGRDMRLCFEPIELADEAGRYVAAFCRPSHDPMAADVSSVLTRAKHRQRDVTREDAMTGLMSGTAFREMLEHDWAIAEREQLTLAMIAFGFDDYDAYLEVFGRHATDSCMRRIAQVIRRHLRRASDVAARIDGDAGGRIVVLSHGSEEVVVREFAVRIAAAVRELGLHHPRSRVSRFATVSFDVVMLRPACREQTAEAALQDLLAAA